MLVQLNTWRGTATGLAQAPGSVVDMPHDEATRLIAAGFASPLQKQIEAAAVIAPECAMKTRPQPRRK
jgi:hypothetical protein